MQTAAIIARITLLALAFVIALVATQGTVRAATITVDTDTVSGSTSGECVAGSGADTITLLAGTYTLTSGSELSVGSDIDIVGAGAQSTIIEAATSPAVPSPFRTSPCAMASLRKTEQAS